MLNNSEFGNTFWWDPGSTRFGWRIVEKEKGCQFITSFVIIELVAEQNN